MSQPKTADLTPTVDLRLLAPGAGPKRTQHPVYADLLPPCNAACPAGEDIQAWLALAQAGRLREAWETLLRDNPMPAVHGRVCYHPCETQCNRGQLDTPISIHAVERFLGECALAGNWDVPPSAPPSGKRVLIVGAGPSGLSAAWHLARRGHQVEIHEAGPLPGGMLHFGIPAYRLPRDVLMNEIARIERSGVKIVLNHKVEDLLAEKAAGGFDAVFVAIGAQMSHHVDIPARDATKVFDAIELLRDVETDHAPMLGRRVVVYGGGNTAMDVARTARRLGASDALIVYHSDRSRMSARAFEADEALAEGVKIQWLTGIRAIDGGAVTVEKMRIDAQGHLQPTGELETLEADAVVLALGQRADSAFLAKVPGIRFNDDGTLAVGPDLMTGAPGIFGGGDVVPGERSVTIATGHGKKAARHIDAWLRGQTYAAPPKHPLADFALLKLPIYSDAEPAHPRELDPARRTESFDEVIGSLAEADALHEAKRCLSCGNCFECDQCYAACPEGAIVKLGAGNGYRIDDALCTGCAVCAGQCPCHALEMVPDGEAG